MHSKSILLRRATLAAVAGALIATGPAMAQRGGGGGGYGSMQSTAPTTSQSMSNMSTSSRVNQPISQVKDPATTLVSANVQDSSGQTIGQVKSVSTTPDGKANAVNVSLTSANGTAKVVSIGANNLIYDTDSKTLKSSLTQSQINSLPVTQSP